MSVPLTDFSKKASQWLGWLVSTARSRRVLSAVLVACGGLALLGNAACIHAKALLGQYLIRDTWAQTLSAVSAGGEVQVKPWSWADTWPVARLQIPQLDIDQIVLAGDSGQALAFGPGHSAHSAQPGEPGTTIISGHRDTHFQFMADLDIGYQIRLQNNSGQRFHYQVTDTQVVDVRKMMFSNAYKSNELLLVTCWPLSGFIENTPYRYLVIAELQSQ